MRTGVRGRRDQTTRSQLPKPCDGGRKRGGIQSKPTQRKLRGTGATIHNPTLDHRDGAPVRETRNLGSNSEVKTPKPKLSVQNPTHQHTMNTNKLVAALVAALSVGSSFAAGVTTTYAVGNQINIAGSTALANQSVPAIHAYAVANQYTLVAADKMDPLTNSAANVTLANLQGTKIALWTKVVTATNGSKITITTNAINLHLLGSEGGTLVTASKTTLPFLPLSFTGKTGGDVKAASGQGFSFDANCTLNANATLTFSDVDQAVGRFNTAKTAPVKCVALTEVAKLAAINFAIAAPSNFPVSNISDRQLQALLLSSNGVPLSMFTGSTGDSSSTVYIAGRDIDSGTRVLTLTESGVGALTSVSQYVWNSTATNFDYSIAGSVNGISYLAGNGGYFSGGDLCTAVGAANEKVSGKYLLGYTSSKDLIGKSGAKALSYNGVQPYSTAATYGFQNSNNVIANGAYSLWSVGRLYKNTANAPKGTDKTIIDAAATAIANTITGATTSDLGYGYTALGDLNVKRATEGATIFKK